jgi:hypothetical protein
MNLNALLNGNKTEFNYVFTGGLQRLHHRENVGLYLGLCPLNWPNFPLLRSFRKEIFIALEKCIGILYLLLLMR